jgi:two-component sensor histidine kinase
VARILEKERSGAIPKSRSSNQDLKDANSKLSARVAELEQSNAEKDILFNEVHHRVNNNLQVIASLLRMQAEAFPDDRVADALRESLLRVESMGLIHAQLYNSVNWRTVDFGRYIQKLAGNLFRSYGVEQTRIAWRVDIRPFELSVDKAIPAGLILNELISNSLKHAFPEGRCGSVLIEGRLGDGRIELAVHDDGLGVPVTTEPRVHQSLGLKIVNILCRQLKGTFEAPDGVPGQSPGSIFRISFPYENGPAKF